MTSYQVINEFEAHFTPTRSIVDTSVFADNWVPLNLRPIPSTTQFKSTLLANDLQDMYI